MLLTPNISCCLLLFAASSVKADPYGEREKLGSVGEFHRADDKILSGDDFDTADSRTANMKYGTDKVSVENFGTPPTPTEGGTKRRTVGSWSSWSQKSNSNFPKRNRKKIETPRSRRRDPMTRPDHSAVERIVVFPCQDEKLRWIKELLCITFSFWTWVRRFEVKRYPWISYLVCPTIYINISNCPGVSIFPVTWTAPTTADGQNHNSTILSIIW